jgi:hypothetical protein
MLCSCCCGGCYEGGYSAGYFDSGSGSRRPISYSEDSVIVLSRDRRASTPSGSEQTESKEGDEDEGEGAGRHATVTAVPAHQYQQSLEMVEA